MQSLQSAVACNLSRVGCIFGVVYMCAIRLIEPTVAWQNSKSVSCKIHAFLQNAISFALLYNGFVSTNTHALYMQKISRISFQCKGYVFLQGIGIEKPRPQGRLVDIVVPKPRFALEQTKTRRPMHAPIFQWP